ncbi:uncharacterized protein LOC107630163 isoform X5 [Arachis ipaensis]|uniref:uncharacterized protein LOC107630163 isoform X5 n=1 Tax=Arachis ipaensis TaxID=130454 RepID=UPI000A2B4504|nr:uncharacterized protein LOC107630163 isoform X5 [Arachis ipaensis]
MMRKEVENDESIKESSSLRKIPVSKVQKQPIRQNPEVTLCCDVRCKIVGRSDEPNVYISNEQTTAAATLSFIQTSISWKHNFCLPVLVPSRDPKSCESRNPMCSKPTPAFKKSQMAAVPVLAAASPSFITNAYKLKKGGNREKEGREGRRRWLGPRHRRCQA